MMNIKIHIVVLNRTVILELTKNEKNSVMVEVQVFQAIKKGMKRLEDVDLTWPLLQ